PDLPPTHLPTLLLHATPAHPPLHSFPTRRSSDLGATRSCRATSATATPSGMRFSSTNRGPSFISPRRAMSTARSPARPPLCRPTDRKSTRLNSSHVAISYAVFCLKKKNDSDPSPS